MNIPKELTTVTTVSKTVALIMFITLPIIAFLFGMRYQTMITEQNSISPLLIPTYAPIACTAEAKICPDGSAVGRTGPKCEFKACPLSQNNVGKIFSGNITSINYGCHADGICSIGVGKGSVIIEKGEGPPGESHTKGAYPPDLLNESKKDSYIGKSVEVYATTTDGRTDSYTIFGNAAYYVKLTNESIPQTMCGGIAGKLCSQGYYCKYDGSYPDASGTCIKTDTTEPNTNKTTYICPKTQFVDCMPGTGPVKTECSTEFLKWATKNCPGFQGAAL